MTPHLRVLVGSDADHLEPITSLVNSGKSHRITSELFDGEIAVYIKGFPSDDGGGEDVYFNAAERKGVTWSIQARGKFLQPTSSDDILFGNTFDHGLNLPWGSGAALKLMTYVDPTLEHDLNSKTKPWALSPLVSTMPYLAHTRGTVPETPFPGTTPVTEETGQLDAAMVSQEKSKDTYKTADKRRAYFREAAKRKNVSFGPEDTISIDFCYGYLSFHPTLSLQLPGGVTLDLTRHWDGQQVRFVCCERRKESAGKDTDPWDRMFWCVAIEPIDDGKDGVAEENNDVD